MLLIFQVKHFLADYVFQTEYHLGKFKAGRDWILPLASHCLVHAIFTFIITIHFADYRNALVFSLFDFLAHFVMDRFKASPELLGQFKPLTGPQWMDAKKFGDKKALEHNKYFWFSLGFDQGWHHVTHYIIIWLML